VKCRDAAFKIFSAVTSNKLDTVPAPITFESDREARVGKIRIFGSGKRRSTCQEPRALIPAFVFGRTAAWIRAR
jgi:hypothetical protein